MDDQFNNDATTSSKPLASTPTAAEDPMAQAPAGPGGQPVVTPGLSQAPMTPPSSPMMTSEAPQSSDGDVMAALSRIESKLDTISTKVGS